MKILVCGGRDFKEYTYLAATLNKIVANFPLFTIIHGDAKGADKLADLWAGCVMFKGRVVVKRFPADWHKHGKAAGHIRNTKMLKEGKPDLVVAFAGGKGTDNMVRQAHNAKVKVLDLRNV